MFKKFLSVFLVVLFTAGALVGCGGNSNSKEDGGKTNSGKSDTLIVALSRAPLHYNGNANTLAGGFPAINIFNGLVATTINGDIIPDLAKDWTISEDGLTYTFNLSENVKWHDDKEFSSEDVKFTFETIVKEKGVNNEKYANIKEIKVPDENTVVFTLNEIDAALISYLSQTKILPKHLYEGTDWLENPANKQPIGTGPFKFVQEVNDVSITLEANKDYFKGEPGVEKIIYKIIPDENTAVQAYINGEVDLLGLPAAISPSAVTSLEKIPNTKIQTMISADRQYLVTNMAKKPWDDVRVREAVALCLDRDAYVEKAHKGYAEKAEGFFTPAVSWAYTDKYKMPERDIEKANKLLDEAGLVKDKNGIRIKDVKIMIFEFAVFSDIATILQSNLKEIGIDAKITTLEYAAWEEKMQAGDFDIGICGGYHGPDPDSMTLRTAVGAWGNFMKYENPEYEAILKAGRVETDEEKRKEIYHEMQRILSEDLPVMPLTEWCYIIVTRDNMTGHPIEMQDKVGSEDYSKIKFE